MPSINPQLAVGLWLYRRLLADAFLIGIFADGHKLNLYSPLPLHGLPWRLSNGSG